MIHTLSFFTACPNHVTNLLGPLGKLLLLPVLLGVCLCILSMFLNIVHLLSIDFLLLICFFCLCVFTHVFFNCSVFSSQVIVNVEFSGMEWWSDCILIQCVTVLLYCCCFYHIYQFGFNTWSVKKINGTTLNEYGCPKCYIMVIHFFWSSI